MVAASMSYGSGLPAPSCIQHRGRVGPKLESRHCATRHRRCSGTRTADAGGLQVRQALSLGYGDFVARDCAGRGAEMHRQSEKRKVGSSTLPLTTRSDQAILPVTCGNATLRYAWPLPAGARPRPLETDYGVHYCTRTARPTIAAGSRSGSPGWPRLGGVSGSRPTRRACPGPPAQPRAVPSCGG